METRPESTVILLNECIPLFSCTEDEKNNASIICSEVYIALVTLTDITDSSAIFAESLSAFITVMHSQNLMYLDPYLPYGVMYFSTVETLPMIMNNLNYTLR